MAHRPPGDTMHDFGIKVKDDVYCVTHLDACFTRITSM
jgi:hypothetical protein